MKYFGDSESITLNLCSFAVIQDGFGAGFSNEDDDVDKAGVSLPHQHPGCLGQIIQACEQTTGQGFVLYLLEEAPAAEFLVFRMKIAERS